MSDATLLEGYRECHSCAIPDKMVARRCFHCLGRLDLKDLLLLEGQKRLRRKRAPILSAVFPGLGHWYSGRRYIGTYFFAMAPLSIGLVLATYQKWNWGLSVLTLSFVLVWFLAIIDSRKGPHYFHPPCQETCPGSVPCSQYVHLAAAGKVRESLELVEAVCPFPGTIGRICHHPCEQNCNRGKDGDPVAICALKRYIDDRTERPYNFYQREIAKSGVRVGKKVAVVGSGPSGLSAALYLRLFGFEVSVFEAREFAGGTPAIYAPEYRLPREIYRREVDRILELDIDFKFGRRLGKDFTLQDLEKDGYSAVYLGLGAMRSVRLPHTGEKSEGFIDGREFLEQVVIGDGMKLPGDVLVIGGGNVAMDVARSALRCGADNVRLICLEKKPKPPERKFHYKDNGWKEILSPVTGEFMPAHRWEIAEAVAEGVEILDAGATVTFQRENGKVAGARCLQVERIDKDPNGRLVPVFRDGSDFTVRADWVITAVGSAPDFSFLGGVPAKKRFDLKAPLVQLEIPEVSVPVLAGGDLAIGPASVIEGIAAGKEAAVHLYLTLVGATPVNIRYRPRRLIEPWANYPDSLDRRRRRQEVMLDMESRRSTFTEVDRGFTEATGHEEAERCTRCDWPLMRESKVKKFFRAVKRVGPEKTSSV
ncbi:MAG: FAD-dependent oxidoreductase [bacterium]|nr:FAD-dependent oxidoreductase [bacterium]MDT8396135.1 FAD-dependent oxidoreductase [bacterium]